MKNVFKIFKEQITNIPLGSRVANFELKSKNNNHYLGSFWDIFNPLIQIIVYWFVFTSVMQRTDVEMANGETIPYIYWMVVGFVVWNFVFRTTIDGSSSVYSRIKTLTKMEFPLAVVPIMPLVLQIKIHFKLMALAYVILLFAGYYPTIKMVQLLYVFPLMLFFFAGLGLLTSTISTIIRDFHQLLSAIMRMFLYVSSVLWQVSIIGGELGNLLRYSPVHYFIEVYRAAIFGTEWYITEHVSETIVVFVISVTIYIIGASLHAKMRKTFIHFA